MAIKLKKIQRPIPNNRETKKWYLSQNTAGAVSLKEITAEIVQRTSLARGDVQNVLTTLVDVMPTFLKLGQSVRLGDFGTFRVSVTSEGKDTPEALSAHDVKQARIVFVSGTELRHSIEGVSFEVIG